MSIRTVSQTSSSNIDPLIVTSKSIKLHTILYKSRTHCDEWRRFETSKSCNVLVGNHSFKITVYKKTPMNQMDPLTEVLVPMLYHENADDLRAQISPPMPKLISDSIQRTLGIIDAAGYHAHVRPYLYQKRLQPSIKLRSFTRSIRR